MFGDTQGSSSQTTSNSDLLTMMDISMVITHKRIFDGLISRDLCIVHFLYFALW